jgi:hypothetical protein
LIQTPKPAGRQGDLGFWVAIAVLWLVPGLVITAAAAAAGGALHTHVVDWPSAAIRDLAAGHGRVQPWRWVGAPRVRSPWLFWTVAAGLLAAFAAAGLAAAVLLRGGIPALFPSRSRPAAQPRWAGARALLAAGLLTSAAGGRRRLVLGWHGRHRVAAPEGESVLVLGGAGAGKSAGLCVPAIEDWDGPVVAISRKTDLVEVTAGVRQHLGRVDVLDPGGRTGLATCSWTAVPAQLGFGEAQELAGGLEPAGEAVRQVLTCALYCAANLGRGVDTALAWLDDLSGETLVRALLQVDGRDPRAVSWTTRVVERGRDERAACFSAARGLLRTHFERAAAASEPPPFRPAQLLAGAGTLFVVAPDEQPAGPDVLTSLLHALETELSRRPPRRPLLLVLDGCAGMSAFQSPGERLAGRDRRLTVLATCASLDECSWLRGSAGTAVPERARTVLFLGGGEDAGTLDLLHRLVARQVQRRRRGRRRLALLGDQDLLPPEAGRQLGRGRAVLVHGRTAPAVLWLRSCYVDPELVRRHREHPFVRGVTAVEQVG